MALFVGGFCLLRVSFGSNCLALQIFFFALHAILDPFLAHSALFRRTFSYTFDLRYPATVVGGLKNWLKIFYNQSKEEFRRIKFLSKHSANL